MTIVEQISKLKDFKNEKEFREFLIDFLRKSGFENVIHTHRYGQPEQGKDIIAMYPNSFEGIDWYAFVVKYGRIGGGTNEIETIKNQIKQSFEYPYVGPDGNKLKINKVKVVTNENFTGGAQSQLSSSPELKVYNNFSFWWNENLIPLIDKHYPDFWLPGDAFAKEYSKAFVKKLHDEIEIRDLSIRKIDDKKIQKLLDIFIEPKLTINVVEEDKLTHEKSVKRIKLNVNSINKIDENLLLSGDQGSGKSKVLNTIASNLASAQNISTNKTLPVRIKAPAFRENDFDILLTVENEVKSLSDGFYADHTLKDYKPVVFLDDFDLLKADEKENLITKLKEFCNNNKTNYVLTYRKNEIDFDKGIKTIKIHNFNIKQIEAFVVKFFEGTERGEKFFKVLKESDILSKLPTTPLTITLISLLYDENNFEIPATLSDIYLDFTGVLLGKLDVRNKTELLAYNIKRRLFSNIALKMLDTKVFEISLDEFGKEINSFLEDRGYEKQSETEIIDIIEKSGLFYKDDNEIVGFKQQAFVEFLASLEIYHHSRDTHYKKLVERFNDVIWQNTAIFYAGHSKELSGMIDDVILNSPNENIKDLFVNSGGMGYLSQALYQTKPSERKKLVIKSLDNLLKAYAEMKSMSEDSNSFIYNMPLPFVMSIINYWFNENFKSITLTKTLEESFEDLFGLENNFENNFKLLMVSTSLMNSYIGKDEKFEKLLYRKEFIEHPVLPLVANFVLDLGNAHKKNVAQEMKEKINKSIIKKRDFIKSVLKEPAYRFNDEFKKLDNNKK